MSKLPYVRFYPKDFRADPLVEVMTAEETGCYILLLCRAWEETPAGTLPADQLLLAYWAKVPPERWEELNKRVLRPFYFDETDSRYHQKRMESEYTKVNSSSRSNAERQRRFRAKHSNGYVTPLCNTLRAYNSDSDSNSNSASEEKKSSAEEEKRNSASLKRRPATAGEVEAFVVGRLKLTRNDALALWEHWLGNGFRNAGRPMANWQATASNWARRNWFFPSLQPNKREFSR